MGAEQFWIQAAFIVVLMFMGFYCILRTYNLLRVLIGLELLMKAVTLAIIAAGAISGHVALAQGIVITVIVLEVVVVVIAAGVVMNFQREFDSLNVRNAKRIKG